MRATPQYGHVFGKANRGVRARGLPRYGDLQHQGLTIEGEAGVRYQLGCGFELAPLMLTQDETRALVTSVRMAQAWQDTALAQASQVALGCFY